MGLSAIEVDPTEEQKREESQLLKDLQEKNYTDPWLSGTHPILEDFFRSSLNKLNVLVLIHIP